MPPCSPGTDFARLGLVDRPPEEALAKPSRAAFDPPLPATLGVVHLQGGGRAWVVGARTPEEDEGLRRLEKLPGLERVVPLSGLVVSSPVESAEQVRDAGAAVGADLVLVYTFESRVTDERTIPLIALPTLGVFPNWIARGTSTASAVLIDVSSGRACGVVEATAGDNRITNIWSLHSAWDRSLRGAERSAFDKLVARIGVLWASAGGQNEDMSRPSANE